MEILQILLPVIWTLVAVACGMILYAKSEAHVQAKGIRVAGAAAIAMLLFGGIYRATPQSWMERTPSGQITVSEGRWRNLMTTIQELQRSSDLAGAACVEGQDQLRCHDAITSIGAAVDRLDEDVRSTLPRSN